MENKPYVVIGVDPGAKGSFCALEVETQKVAFYLTTEKPMDIYNWIKSIERKYNILVIMIENVHSLPKVSAKSNFNFGYNVGIVNTVSQVTGNRVDTVTPKIWQKAIGVKSTVRGKDIKHAVAAICEKLYPKVNVRGPRGGLLDGLSDSLMITHYALLKYKTK